MGAVEVQAVKKRGRAIGAPSQVIENGLRLDLYPPEASPQDESRQS